MAPTAAPSESRFIGKLRFVAYSTVAGALAGCVSGLLAAVLFWFVLAPCVLRMRMLSALPADLAHTALGSSDDRCLHLVPRWFLGNGLPEQIVNGLPRP